MKAVEPNSRDAKKALGRIVGGAVALVAIILSVIAAQAATGGKQTETIAIVAPPGGGLAVGSSGGSCGSGSGGSACSFNLSFTLDSNDKHRVFFTSLPQFSVQDLSGTGKGWTLTLQATQFTCVAKGKTGNSCTLGQKLPLASLYTLGPSVSCGGSACSSKGGKVLPAILLSSTSLTTIDNASPAAVAREDPGNGMGAKYVFTPRIFACLPTGNGNGG